MHSKSDYIKFTSYNDAKEVNCKYHRVNFRGGGSYIDSPEWIKQEKSNKKSEKIKMINVFNMR